MVGEISWGPHEPLAGAAISGLGIFHYSMLLAFPAQERAEKIRKIAALTIGALISMGISVMARAADPDPSGLGRWAFTIIGCLMVSTAVIIPGCYGYRIPPRPVVPLLQESQV